MTFGARAQALATRLITNGDKWTHDAVFTYGPRRTKTNKWDEATDSASISPQTVRVAAFPVEKALEEGGRKIAMWKITVPVPAITVRPDEQDTITLDGVRCKIISVDPIGANGTDAIYQIMVRR